MNIETIVSDIVQSLPVFSAILMQENGTILTHSVRTDDKEFDLEANIAPIQSILISSHSLILNQPKWNALFSFITVGSQDNGIIIEPIAHEPAAFLILFYEHSNSGLLRSKIKPFKEKIRTCLKSSQIEPSMKKSKGTMTPISKRDTDSKRPLFENITDEEIDRLFDI